MHRLIMLSSDLPDEQRADDPQAAERRPGEPAALAGERPAAGGRGDPRRACWPSSGTLDRTDGRARCCTSRTASTSSTTRRRTRPTYDSRRRSLYLPVIRNNLYDVFQLFDFPDADRRRAATGRRRPSPPQALFLLNSDLVAQASRATGRRRCSSAPDLDDAGRVRLLYRTGLRPAADATPETAAGRWPSSREFEAALRRARSRTPSSAACRRGRACARSIVASNEFIYVRVNAEDERPMDPTRRSPSRAARCSADAPSGFGYLALASLLAEEPRPHAAERPAGAAAAALPAAGEAGHLPVHEGRAVARRHVRLQAAARRATTASRCPFAKPRVQFAQTGNLLESPWKFQQHGQSGMPVSELFPHVARLRRRPLLHPLAARHQRRPTAGRC